MFQLHETSSLLLKPFLFTLVAIVLILLFKWYSTTTENSPPSPPKLPIIGNLHQLGMFPHRSLQALSHRHGPLMLLHFGSVPVLVVSSSDAAREVLKTNDLAFSDRPQPTAFKKLLYNCKDVGAAPYGEHWRQVRSICVLNMLSNKRVRSFRYVREEETKSMINKIKDSSLSSAVVNLSQLFVTLTNDVVSRVALGRKYKTTGGEGGGRVFKELLEEFGDVLGSINVGDYIPWLSWLSCVNGLDAKTEKIAKQFDDFVERVIQEHMIRRSKGGNRDQNDFVDVLLGIQEENSDGTGFAIDRDTIKAVILDMFAAGTDTTYTVLDWTMTELLRHPRIMTKLQNEVRGVAGNRTDIITEDDLVEMHYLKAVIKETLRLHTPVPLLIPRKSTQDVEINGYTIKAKTQVMINAWQIARDPKLYDKPEEYLPERFLNSDIDYKGNNFELIPFGAGRRICPGIQFAMAVNELALANVVHRFDWALPGGRRGEDIDMTENTGLTIHRKYPLKVVATPYSC